MYNNFPGGANLITKTTEVLRRPGDLGMEATRPVALRPTVTRGLPLSEPRQYPVTSRWRGCRAWGGWRESSVNLPHYIMRRCRRALRHLKTKADERSGFLTQEMSGARRGRATATRGRNLSAAIVILRRAARRISRAHPCNPRYPWTQSWRLLRAARRDSRGQRAPHLAGASHAPHPRGFASLGRISVTATNPAARQAP